MQEGSELSVCVRGRCNDLWVCGNVGRDECGIGTGRGLQGYEEGVQGVQWHKLCAT